MRPRLEQYVHGRGGVIERSALVALTSRREVDAALREQRLVRAGRGTYALPLVKPVRLAAARLHAVASHRTAAEVYGWELKHSPHQPCLTVGRSRKLRPGQREGVELHWATLRPNEVNGGWVTTPARTFLDCCRTMPFDEALAVGDSALRGGNFSKDSLVELAESFRGPGAPMARRVAAEATALAANAFESTLRAIAVEVPGLTVVPQELIATTPFSIRPDLVDPQLRIAIEADSFAWHASREALRRDCQRYTLVAVNGWILVRFSWEDVMLRPTWVRETLERAVALARRRAGSPGGATSAA